MRGKRAVVGAGVAPLWEVANVGKGGCGVREKEQQQEEEVKRARARPWTVTQQCQQKTSSSLLFFGGFVVLRRINMGGAPSKAFAEAAAEVAASPAPLKITVEFCGQ